MMKLQTGSQQCMKVFSFIYAAIASQSRCTYECSTVTPTMTCVAAGEVNNSTRAGPERHY